LICDDFRTYKIPEILKFYFENNILLCRLSFYIFHKFQFCDIATFASLKATYRNQIDRLKQGNINTIDRKHFTFLYSPAKEIAFTLKNIKAGFSASGLFPFNPDRCSEVCPPPPAELAIPRADEVKKGLVGKT